MADSGGGLPAKPFVRNVAHRLRCTILDPGHEGSIKFEARPALVNEKAAHILGILVVLVDQGCARDDAAMPIEIHVTFPFGHRTAAPGY